MTQQTQDPRLVIVDTPFDCNESEQPFGKRWREERITLTVEHLTALQHGKLVALDVQGEYVVYLEQAGVKNSS
ncbi:hypothetical protein [Nitrincola alkalilacustris]|uniref:hypothetical protein n=1 Tax=Nitrincola alkalilacustris TaxID=1571224 RepID=UPI00197EBB5B|nr:hypothetical protein [Nitrincola alkalilacustris]